MTRLRRLAIFFLALAVVGGPRVSLAASPGVPVLPSTPNDYVKYAVTDLPRHFTTGTMPGLNNTPVDNPITNAGAALGRALFYDERVSHNDSTSCASCHKQENDFSDTNQLSVGFEGGLTGRHSMGLANGAYYDSGKFFWDERAATLEDQVLMPIQDPVEMGMSLPILTAKLSATTFYPQLFQNAFGTPEVTPERISKSLAQFVRSMVSYNSKFDDAVNLGNTINTPNFVAAGFTAQEIEGRNIFHGTGGCNQCHVSQAQIGDAPANIGLDINNLADAGVGGPGVGTGKFKTPSLRNVEVRGGYMHDGRFTTLEEVVEFYNSGVQNNPSLDPRMKSGGVPRKLNLTQAQKEALVAFLKTLTDDEFLANEMFSNPFVDLPGDFDGNGVVEGADLALWKTNFGSADPKADANNDGRVDGGDFLIWQRNLGQSWEDLQLAAASTTAATVPEPSAGVILAMAALGLGGFHRRRGRHASRVC